MSELWFVTNQLVDKTTAQIPAGDWGVLFGYGVFETLRVYSGRPFRLVEHIKRLKSGAEVINLILPLSEAEIIDAVAKVIKANSLGDASLRITLTHGCPSGKPNLIIYGSNTIPYGLRDYERGFRLCVSEIRRNPVSPLVGIKSLNYLDNLLARREAKKKGFDEVLFLNTAGFLAEGSASNIFVVQDNRLYTPGKDCGLLPGIARQEVIQLVAEQGIGVTEGYLPPEILNEADEVFLTNSLLEVMPVVLINSTTIGTGSPGKLTKRIHKLYQQRVNNNERFRKI